MDGIYLVIDGHQTGPFTIEQVRQTYLKRAVSKDALAWYEGLEEWTTLAKVLEAFPDTEWPPSITSLNPETVNGFTKNELRDIAKAQNTLMFSVLAGIAALLLAKIPLIGMMIVLGTCVFQIYALYDLGSQLRMKHVWLYCLGLFIPVVALIILLIVSGKASKVLRAAGLRIGFLGGNPDDIKN